MLKFGYKDRNLVESKGLIEAQDRFFFLKKQMHVFLMCAVIYAAVISWIVHTCFSLESPEIEVCKTRTQGREPFFSFSLPGSF